MNQIRWKLAGHLRTAAQAVERGDDPAAKDAIVAFVKGLRAATAAKITSLDLGDVVAAVMNNFTFGKKP